MPLSLTPVPQIAGISLFHRTKIQHPCRCPTEPSYPPSGFVHILHSSEARNLRIGRHTIFLCSESPGCQHWVYGRLQSTVCFSSAICRAKESSSAVSSLMFTGRPSLWLTTHKYHCRDLLPTIAVQSQSACPPPPITPFPHPPISSHRYVGVHGEISVVASLCALPPTGAFPEKRMIITLAAIRIIT